MGRLVGRDYEGEMVAKIRTLFERALETVNKDHPSYSFGFEQFADMFDENDGFVKHVFEFLVKEAARRHRATYPYENFPRPPTIHHYRPRNPTSPSPSSPSASLSSSLSSLAFSNRLLRHQQLAAGLLASDDEDSTDLETPTEVIDTWRSARVFAGGVSNSRATSSGTVALSSTAESAGLMPLRSVSSSPILGTALRPSRPQTRYADLGFDEDTDSDDDFILSRMRRDLGTQLDSEAALAARVALRAEMRSRQAAADLFSEVPPIRSSTWSSASALSSSWEPPRTRSGIDWFSSLSDRHGSSAALQPASAPAHREESTMGSAEMLYLGALRSDETSSSQRRLHYLRHVESMRFNRRRRRENQAPLQPPMAQYEYVRTAPTSAASGPVSVPSGSLITSNDNGLRIRSSSVVRRDRLASTLTMQPSPSSSTANVPASPVLSGSTGPAPVSSAGIEPAASQHTPPGIVRSLSVLPSHASSIPSVPSGTAYRNFSEATRRARTALRAVTLASEELESISRRSIRLLGDSRDDPVAGSTVEPVAREQAISRASISSGTDVTSVPRVDMQSASGSDESSVLPVQHVFNSSEPDVTSRSNGGAST